jgi:hypothetical protein
LGWVNESQIKLPHALIIPAEQWKTNPVLGGQMARSLLIPTTISILIQHSKEEERDDRKCFKHCTVKCLFS